MKNVLLPVNIAPAQSLAASFSSAVTDIRFLDNISIQVNLLGGAPVGTFVVETCSDYKAFNPSTGNGVNGSGTWTTALSASTAGGFPMKFKDFQEADPFIRVSYVRTGGAGTVDIFISAKAV